MPILKLTIYLYQDEWNPITAEQRTSVEPNHEVIAPEVPTCITPDTEGKKVYWNVYACMHH